MITFNTFKVGALGTSLILLSGCLSDEGQADKSQFTDTIPSPGTQNSAPQISGSPDAAVASGNVYSFQPTATDEENDPLSFSIENLPDWADFDSTSGRLSGQAFLGNVGVYENIRISVTDGELTSALPDFSITVTDAGVGSMSLSWTPPTQNTDGSALTDLAGYKVYYGQAPGNYSRTVQFDNPSISTVLIENLVPDTYYVVATSFNSSGIESAYSNEVVKSVAAN